MATTQSPSKGEKLTRIDSPMKDQMQSQSRSHMKKVRRENPSVLRQICAWLVANQVGLSLNYLILLASTYILFPRLRPWTTSFFRMSYFEPESGMYTRGMSDIYFVCTWVVIFTGLRAAMMDYVLKPYAMSHGVVGKKRQLRFAEQGWLFIYDSCSWTLGMYIMYHTSYFFNLREMWSNYPLRGLTPLFKFYYLVQTSFWLQQLLVIHIEERRKDHWQMLTHHVFTNALLVFSYGIYQTQVGNVILCIMDAVDIVLAFAKMLNYLNYRTACDAAFGVFIFTWVLTRHIFYNMVCYSIWKHIPQIITYGCYTFSSGTTNTPTNLATEFASANQPGVSLGTNNNLPFWQNIFHGFIASEQPETPACFGSTHVNAFLVLLVGLQLLLIIWFGMIVNVAYSVLTGKAAEDSRSDDENEGEEEEEFEQMEMGSQQDGKHTVHMAASEALNRTPLPPHLQYQEEEVGVEGLHLVSAGAKRRASPVTRSKARRSGASRASGISIAGHSDRKELLGRIGCDKPS